MIKTSKELVEACLNVVNNCKTVYVMGCFGAPMNESNKTRYLNSYSYNRNEPHRTNIQNATADTFGFDCICFIKGLFWGFCGDPKQQYGGAVYKSNGIPDISADALIKQCTDVSTDFSNIMPGEYVWLPGHCGIYIGDGLAAESTFEPVSGVQLQAVLPMGNKPGYPATGWQKHGKLPWITYNTAPVVETKPAPAPTPSTGFKVGDEVKLIPGATYTNGRSPASFVFNKKLYVREIRGTNIVISTVKIGAVTGVVASSNLVPYTTQAVSKPAPTPAPVEAPSFVITVGAEVRLKKGATYSNGKYPAAFVYNKKLYVRELRANGTAVISTVKTGAITGVVFQKDLEKYE